MKILYGTSNQAKYSNMKRFLASLELEIVSLNDYPDVKVEIDEAGATPIENARLKAIGRFEVFGMPVFACDSGLYIDGVPEHEQPGVNVRRVGGKHLSDEEMVEYYSTLVKNNGGRLRARYKNAICFILDSEHIYEYDGHDIWDQDFCLVSTPHPKRVKGFPLDCLSVDVETGKYYYDTNPGENNNMIGKGFENFFRRVLGR